MLLPFALAGCGKGDSSGDPFADSVVETFQADCQRASVGNAKPAQHQQLCACTAEKIRASGLKASDGDKINNDKIHAAQQACLKQALGSRD